jgi:hypothetical protein
VLIAALRSSQSLQFSIKLLPQGAPYLERLLNIFHFQIANAYKIFDVDGNIDRLPSASGDLINAIFQFCCFGIEPNIGGLWRFPQGDRRLPYHRAAWRVCSQVQAVPQ